MTRSLIPALALLVLLAPTLASAQEQDLEELRRDLEELQRSTEERIKRLEEQLEERAPAETPSEEPATDEAPAADSPEAEDETVRDTIRRIRDRLFSHPTDARSEDPDPLGSLTSGRELEGNVYTSDSFRLKLGLSLRLHTQFSTTPIGENLRAAVFPLSPDAEEDNFRAHMNRSRIMFAAQGPEVLSGATYGYMEVDFQQSDGLGERESINQGVRMRHVYVRWSFPDLFAEDRGLELTIGQTGSSFDMVANSVDGNVLLGNGATHRRNPRVEALLLWRLVGAHNLALGLGAERPFFGDDVVANDLGPGDLSGYPALSVGLGYFHKGRQGGTGFGFQKLGIGARATYGSFEEDFSTTTINPSLNPPPNLDHRRFENVALHGGLRLEHLGFAQEGKAGTLSLTVGGLWAQGDALHLDAGFDRRTVLSAGGRPREAESMGGFISLSFWFFESLSVRYSLGQQLGLDTRRVPVTGSFTGGDYVRRRSTMSEISLWWTPGPFTFAISWNNLQTVYRQVDPTTGFVNDERGKNDRVEFVIWFTF